MQIVETTNEGLKRAYAVTIPAKEIDSRIDAELKKIAPQVRMPGFRPGKVPANLIRKMHGEALHSDAFNATVRDSIDKLMRDKKLRPAMQPKIDLGEGYEPGKNVELKVELEVLPQIETPSIDGIKLERLNVPVADSQVDEALANLASNQKSWKAAPKTKTAAEGDQLVIDFVGRVDGQEFEGGKAENAPLAIGSGQFIPGFEEQLTGLKAGDAKTITVNFPGDYPAAHLAGKQAEFDVVVRELNVEAETKVDDGFAKSLGLESLDQLKGLLRGQVEQETAGLTRTQLKRQLLDKLAADHDFDVPQGMVEAEFEQIWQQLLAEAERDEDSAAVLKEIEGDREDYRRIAVRRVRLGLLLSEIGQANGVEVTPQEMQMLVEQASQQYRQEDREKFLEYVRNEPMVQAQIRAPIYEEKVVDFLFSKAEISDRDVTREELEAAIEAEETTAPAKSEKKKPAAKKAPVKKEAAAKPAAKKAEKAPAAKKAPAKKAEAKPAAKKPAAKKPAAKKAPAKK